MLGLDLVRPSDAVLGFAFDAAHRRGATLRVVHGWNPPSVLGYSPAIVDPDLGAELAENEDNALMQTLRPWQDKFPDVPLITQTAVGAASHHLVEAAADSSLLVIGHRPCRTPAGPHLATVTRAVLHRVTAPIAVVPHE